MHKKDIVVITLLAIIMAAVALFMGKWFESLNPDGLTLNSPTEELEDKTVSAFGFGASIGLLLSSLLYCVVAAGILIRSKVKNRTAGFLPVAIAVLAAVGFSLSYVVDGYFVS